jgi:rod shape-determining protein MreD
MPWWWFAIALVVTHVLQGAVLPHTWEVFDLYLVLAIVCGLAAPTYDARIAAWIVGLAQDLGSRGPLGLHAFVLGLTGLLLTQLRERTFRQPWWVRWLLGSLASFPGQVLLILHLRFYDYARIPSWWGALGGALSTAVVNALLAALVLAILTHRRLPRRHPFSLRR